MPIFLRFSCAIGYVARPALTTPPFSSSHRVRFWPKFRPPLNHQMSERDPLLQHHEQQQGEGYSRKGVNRAPGPLDISRSTRYGILAGLWMGTFLSVSL